ncbi:MAG: methionine--tRNA ligase [Nitrospiria bacterium]
MRSGFPSFTIKSPSWINTSSPPRIYSRPAIRYNPFLKSMTKKFYITTPIYYVNDIPHIGHAYTTIAADVLARYHRLLHEEVFFLTGTDEHGQKVEQAAKKRGVPPKEHADELVPGFKSLWRELHISNDDFIRTTEDRHREAVSHVLTQLWEKGEIYADTYTGWYCLPDERFWTEKEIIDGKCPDCHRPVEALSERNYFFRMGRYRDRLRQHILENPAFIQPESRRNEVLGFLENPLNDLCISRPKHRLAWGIPLPFDQDYVTYVWLDALVNYISAPGYLREPARFQGWWPANVHLVGKDILTTHAVYWMTALMALDLPLPRKLFAHGWWTIDGEKMSKSLGNTVNPSEMARTFGVDAFRYFLLRQTPFGNDGDFSEKALIHRINSDLANDVGNLLSRTLTMLERYADGQTPEAIRGSAPEDAALKEAADALFDRVDHALDRLEFQKALVEIWQVVRAANQYIEKGAPWQLAKDPEKKERLRTVLYYTTEAVCIVARLIAPFMPGAAREMKGRLGLSETEDKEPLNTSARWGNLPAGRPVSKGEPLFPRIRPEKKSTLPPKAASQKKSAALPLKPQVSIDDFSKLDLRAGVIRSATKIEKAKKLLLLQVDIENEQRQVVAGIASKYAPDALIGKKVILIANLKPATIMGVESRGMLLAAGGKTVLGLATFEEDIPPGSTVR